MGWFGFVCWLTLVRVVGLYLSLWFCLCCVVLSLGLGLLLCGGLGCLIL